MAVRPPVAVALSSGDVDVTDCFHRPEETGKHHPDLFTVELVEEVTPGPTGQRKEADLGPVEFQNVGNRKLIRGPARGDTVLLVVLTVNSEAGYHLRSIERQGIGLGPVTAGETGDVACPVTEAIVDEGLNLA
jgi:hypothetical protein